VVWTETEHKHHDWGPQQRLQ